MWEIFGIECKITCWDLWNIENCNKGLNNFGIEFRSDLNSVPRGKFQGGNCYNVYVRPRAVFRVKQTLIETLADLQKDFSYMGEVFSIYDLFEFRENFYRKIQNLCPGSFVSIWTLFIMKRNIKWDIEKFDIRFFRNFNK